MSEHSLKEEVTVALESSIERALLGAHVSVVSSGGGHFSLHVVWSGFEGKSPVAAQRSVYSAIAHLMKGENAPVHAIDKLITAWK